MSNDYRSDKLYEQWLQASSKFDYFVLTVSLAVLGYLSSSFRPVLSSAPDALELVAMLAILGSTIVGFKRVEATVVTLGAGVKARSKGESAGALMTAVGKGGGEKQIAVNKETGELMSVQQMLQQATDDMAGAKAAEASFSEWSKRSQRLYRWRNRLFLGGIAALILARIWGAFGRA